MWYLCCTDFLVQVYAKNCIISYGLIGESTRTNHSLKFIFYRKSAEFFCDVFQTGLSALHIAAFSGQVGFVRTLLANGVSVMSLSERPTVINSLVKDTRAEPGLTVLHLASLAGHEHVVRLLLLHGELRVDAKAAVTGSTALHWAAMNGHMAVVHLLMGNADLNLRDQRGRGALMWAAVSGFAEMADLLLHQGSDVNATDNVWNILHYCTLHVLKFTPQYHLRHGRQQYFYREQGLPMHMYS